MLFSHKQRNAGAASSRTGEKTYFIIHQLFVRLKAQTLNLIPYSLLKDVKCNQEILPNPIYILILTGIVFQPISHAHVNLKQLLTCKCFLAQFTIQSSLNELHAILSSLVSLQRTVQIGTVQKIPKLI